MELVTVACIALNRIGSANAAGFGYARHRRQQFFTEVADGDVDTLRQKVIEVAEANGEQEGVLHSLEHAQNLGFPPGQTVFDVQGLTTQYSEPYAACVVFPALKVAGVPGPHPLLFRIYRLHLGVASRSRTAC
ncbi:MAG: hypothetical protein P0Y58_16530 [Candidatus Pseudomonas phytovorans]|uniref:Uncharacterized protein n=1 Tax=Candidatus Pseudomonas phytovorans TaxID=3121377 RepID=A0AAJ5WB66_9PSED|nr:hypothetical protein [Pseudomonas sp.]WEK28511.1 MAG: hypothetical protein P0Y58_16530 [Pseudomonas sp.]